MNVRTCLCLALDLSAGLIGAAIWLVQKLQAPPSVVVRIECKDGQSRRESALLARGRENRWQMYMLKEYPDGPALAEPFRLYSTGLRNLAAVQYFV